MNWIQVLKENEESRNNLKFLVWTMGGFSCDHKQKSSLKVGERNWGNLQL